ncbi:MAG: hypothetical protein K1X57_20715, partial [Gemmataceae bacterium]|nr:hypothetical protein [Gemmataceae bacterium]
PKTHQFTNPTTIVGEESQGYQEVPPEVVVESYTGNDGVKVPAKLSIQRGGKPFIVEEYSGWVVSDKVDAKKFAKP